MNNEMLSKLVADELATEVKNNRAAIIAGLHSILPDGKTIDPDLEMLLLATIHLSAQFSAQYLIRVLEQAGLLSLPAEGSPILFPISGEQ